MASELKEKMLAEMKRRFERVESVHVLAIATLLDPRFKKHEFMHPLECSRTIKYVKEMMMAMASDRSVQENESSESDQSIGKQQLLLKFY